MALRGKGCAVGGECIAQSAGGRRGCVGERKCSGRACRCAGTSEGLRRGMLRAACGRGSGLRGRASGLRGGAEVLGEGVSLCGGERRSSAGEWVVRSVGNASRSLRACVGAAWGNGSTRGGRVAVRGRAEVFGGEWVVRSVGNASRSLRACVGTAWASGSARAGLALCGGERRSSAGNGW